jgi:transposase
MKSKSKVILGFKQGGTFTEEERHQIIQEYLSSGKTKIEIWHKYTGQTNEHGHLLQWMRQLGYQDEQSLKRIGFDGNQTQMAKKKNIQGEDSFEILQLKKRILELENQLKDAEMKAIAFSTMVDIAEEQFNIPIRKKVSTKPLKK